MGHFIGKMYIVEGNVITNFKALAYELLKQYQF